MRAYIAVVVWVASGRIAQAEPQRSAAQTPAAQRAAVQSAAAQNPAEVAFNRGRQLADSGDHERACPAFELSQRLDPQFGTLFNLAGCYVNTRKIARAWQLYRELSRSDSNAERREEAARLAAKLEVRVPTVRVRVPDGQQPPALRVSVGDTEVTSLLDVDIPFDPGYHEISASSPGYLPFRRKIYVYPKEAVSVDVELEREPDPVAEPAVPGRASGRLGAKLMIGAGAGLMVVGAVAGWRWYATDSDQDSTPWATVTGLTLVFGAMGAALGGVMLAEPHSSRALRVAPAVGSGSASVFVGGAF